VAVVAALASVGGLSGCASCSRGAKTLAQDVGGGTNRTVTVYDYDGERLREWKGRIDYQRDGEGILFDMDGKRYSVVGGIIVTEED
jgi:hypothetical protein